MSALPQPRFSVHEYLAIERESEIRHDFYGGRMSAMSGASVEHNRIARNLLVDLHNQLKGTPCEPFVNDMRVKVSASGLYLEATGLEAAIEIHAIASRLALADVYAGINFAGD